MKTVGQRFIIYEMTRWVPSRHAPSSRSIKNPTIGHDRLPMLDLIEGESRRDHVRWLYWLERITGKVKDDEEYS